MQQTGRPRGAALHGSCSTGASDRGDHGSEPRRRSNARLRKFRAKDLTTLRLAAKRIAAFHRRQLQKSWQYRDPLGMVLGQRITPLERVGVYVPGGKASYPSTVLMNAIPAKVAGVKEIIMTSPIGDDGAIILAAAQWPASIEFFASAAPQAIAALAFGTADDTQSR